LRKQLGNGFGRRGDLNAATHGQAQQITGRIVDKSNIRRGGRGVQEGKTHFRLSKNLSHFDS
jgi:hypothetical protein